MEALRKLEHFNFLHPTAALSLSRRSAIDKAGSFVETVHGAEDYDLWLKCAIGGSRFDRWENPGPPASGTQSLVLEIDDDTGAAHEGHPSRRYQNTNHKGEHLLLGHPVLRQGALATIWLLCALSATEPPHRAVTLLALAVRLRYGSYCRRLR